MKVVLTGKLESHREIFRGEKKDKNKFIKSVKKLIIKRKNNLKNCFSKKQSSNF